MEFNQSFFQQKLKSGIEFFNRNKLNEAIECFKFLENEKSTQIIAFLYLGIIEIKKKNNENAKIFFFKMKAAKQNGNVIYPPVLITIFVLFFFIKLID